MVLVSHWMYPDPWSRNCNSSDRTLYNNPIQFPVQNPNEEAATPSDSPTKDMEGRSEAAYDVTAPVNREKNARQTAKGSNSFMATAEWVR